MHFQKRLKHKLEEDYYCAPESLFSFQYSLDIWSFGICVYALLTGSYPFSSRERAISDDLPDLNEMRVLKGDNYLIDKKSCEFVGKLLEKDYNLRLSDEVIKNDPFYFNFDWDKLDNGKLRPPIEPNVVITLILNTFKFIMIDFVYNRNL